MDVTPSQTVADNSGFLSIFIWSGLGLIGAGLKVGVDMGKGTRLNPWQIGTTLVAGSAFAGVSTQAIVERLGVEWSAFAGAVALITGLMAMGFVSNALEGRIPFLNKFMGPKDGA